ncbi:ALKB7 dioxygenase, partial [Paradoxornis webbianus]|nr:ALKB7 dioxygenase [Sinosuthora webbiana]
PSLLRASSPELARRLRGLALVRGGFVSDGEAAELLREVEPGLGRGRYQNDHWDRVRGVPGELGGSGSGRSRGVGKEGLGVPAGFEGFLGALWVGEFWGSEGGFEGSQVCPSPQFCGCTIAGVSLLSPSVLRLRSLRKPQDWLELLLEPGALYVLRGAARYEFTHEILPDEESFFGELRVPRGRRVALIFRNDPPGENP